MANAKMCSWRRPSGVKDAAAGLKGSRGGRNAVWGNAHIQRDGHRYSCAMGKTRTLTTRTTAFKAIDSIVNQLNQVIGSAGDMYGEQGGPLNTTEDKTMIDMPVEDGIDDSVMLDTTGHKKIAVKLKVRDTVSLQDYLTSADIEASAGEEQEGKQRVPFKAALGKYLSIPVENYSVLNSDWISKVEEEGEGHFVLRIPLQEMIGIQLEPSLQAEVRSPCFASSSEDPSAESGTKAEPPQVMIIGREASTGSKIFDELIMVSFTLLLKQKSSKKDDDATLLTGSLDLDMNISVPTPLSMLPSPVLKGAIRTLFGLVMKRMLTGFLALLMKDFVNKTLNQFDDLE